jgi:epsin
MSLRLSVLIQALTVFLYLLENGPELIIRHVKANIHVFKTLKEFQYIDEEGRDQGVNVRQKSKEICELIADEFNSGSLLKDLRSKRGSQVPPSSNSNNSRVVVDSGEDQDLARAIHLSKLEHEKESNMKSQEYAIN